MWWKRGIQYSLVSLAALTLLAAASLADDTQAELFQSPPPAYLPFVHAGAFVSPLPPPSVYLPQVTRSYPSPGVQVDATALAKLAIPVQADLEIVDVAYDNADEWIRISNREAFDVDLSDWRIQALKSYRWYTFPPGLALESGASVYIHSGPEAHDGPPTHLLWTFEYVWEETADMAFLYDSTGVLVDRFCYGPSCP